MGAKVTHPTYRLCMAELPRVSTLDHGRVCIEIRLDR